MLYHNSLRDYIEDAPSASWDTAWHGDAAPGHVSAWHAGALTFPNPRSFTLLKTPTGFAVDLATGLHYLHSQQAQKDLGPIEYGTAEVQSAKVQSLFRCS